MMNKYYVLKTMPQNNYVILDPGCNEVAFLTEKLQHIFSTQITHSNDSAELPHPLVEIPNILRDLWKTWKNEPHNRTKDEVDLTLKSFEIPLVDDVIEGGNYLEAQDLAYLIRKMIEKDFPEECKISINGLESVIFRMNKPAVFRSDFLNIHHDHIYSLFKDAQFISASKMCCEKLSVNYELFPWNPSSFDDCDAKWYKDTLSDVRNLAINEDFLKKIRSVIAEYKESLGIVQ